jgi:hypothetical protein
VVSGPEDALPSPHFSRNLPLIRRSGSLPFVLFSVSPQYCLLTSLDHCSRGGVQSPINTEGYIAVTTLAPGLWSARWGGGEEEEGCPNWWEKGRAENLLDTEGIRYSRGTYWRDAAHKSIWPLSNNFETAERSSHEIWLINVIYICVTRVCRIPSLLFFH